MREVVTIVDVAKAAGVSPATVTHALNGKRPVGEATRKKVLEAIEQLGYVPSWNASRMKRGNSGIIGCLAADITETFVNQIVRGIEHGLSGGQYSLFFVSGVEFGNDLKKAYNFLKSHKVEGILFCHHIPIWKDFNLDTQNPDIPIVSINMAAQEMTSVVVDNTTGGYQAAEHLYGCGMRHPAMICGPEDRLSVQDRLKGFSQRAKELNLQMPSDSYYGNYDFNHGYEAAKQLMKGYPQTDGIFCANDYIAAGAISALKDLHYDIPSQVRVVGFDNRDFSEFWQTPITTFELPLQEMGMLGVSLLKQVIHTGNYSKTQHVLQSKLIPRQSSKG
ncbi:LacI family DNA-binding transcriptional regulator [Sphaerochaeta globosa]|uniref:Transcriptional regulator, LacI family n=1 Tax=Sphaerochaeta globosa (strain ATCC BAA-1886 / DSM 22777 / Buddy) TaxID=158189 RepID=F0RXV7_SPHGB|nr:LacI family DNA-binding transcriptional regulator [Sphaerochaeta globosa]ADY12234.1 transcriptional regulator, LacI family [Sphaerochaeta globosa str. Buddy]